MSRFVIKQQPEAATGRFVIKEAASEMPASESQPATDPIAKYFGLSLNQQQGIPAAVRQGLTLGFADEIGQGATWLGNKLGLNDVDPEEALNEERRKVSDFKQAHPGQALATEIVGSLPTAVLPVGQLSRGASLGKRTLQGMKIGAGYGGVSGFGHGEGGALERGLDAATGTATGALLGGATVPVLDVAGRVVKAATAPVRAYMAPTRTANAKILEALERDQGGVTGRMPQAGKSATKRLMADPDTMLADLGGENTQGLIKQALNMPNAARETFKTKIDARQARQVTRFTNWIEKEMGSPQGYEAALQAQLQKRSGEAKKAFAHAYSRPPVTSPQKAQGLLKIMETPLGQDLVRSVQTQMANKQRPLTNVMTTEFVHRMKMEIDALIGEAKRRVEGATLSTRQGNKVFKYRDLVDFKRRFMDQIDSPSFKFALERYADNSKVIGAMEKGFETGLKDDAIDLASEMAGMSQMEQIGYRMGVAKALTGKVRSGNQMHDRVKRNFMDKAFMDKLRVALGRKKFRQMQAFVGVKGRQAETRRFLQSGSDTARNLMEMENAAQDVQNVATIGKGLVDPSSIMSAIGRQYSRLTGMTPGVANAILTRMGQNANGARYTAGAGPYTSKDVDRMLKAMAAGQKYQPRPGTYNNLIKALLASEGQAAGR